MRRLKNPIPWSLIISTILAAAHSGDAAFLPWPALRNTLWTKRDISKRSQTNNNNVTIPSAISIGASQYWSGDDGPWSSFPLQVGTGAVGGLQDVEVMISTAATDIWTIGPEGCPSGYVANCAESRGGLFYTNQSLTWSPNSIYETGLEINLGFDSSGYAGFDVATLGWQGSGSTVTDDHSIIFSIADSRFWTGIFGLNPRPTNFTTFTNPQTSFMQAIFDQDRMPSISYGYTAGNQYRFNEVFGSLTLGGYDSNRFVPNNVTFNFYEDISRDLLVYLHGITTDKGSPSNLLPDGSISIFIDSTVPGIWLPESSCSAFEEAFGIVWNTTCNRYLITSSQRQQLLSQNAQITFTIGPKQTGGETVDITLPYGAFDLQVNYPIVASPNTSYYFPLMRAANETQYTLGRTFLQEAYLIADYERQNFSVSACEWDQAEVSTQNIVSIISPTKYPTESKSHFPVAAIVGIAVGVFVVLALLVLTMILIRRKKNIERVRQAALEAEEAAKAEAAIREKLRTSDPLVGELGYDDVHELTAQQLRRIEMTGVGRPTPSRHGWSEMAVSEYYGRRSEQQLRNHGTEMHGSTPIYEMAGSDVSEMSARRSRVPSTVPAGFI